MSLDSKHPQYSEKLQDWQQMRHTYAGERTVKDQGARYLPPTTSMCRNGAGGVDGRGLVIDSKGWRDYCAYRARARFPDWVRETVRALVGVMHRKPAQIEVPPQLEPLLERATAQGESLQMLLRRINEEQLVVGRVGLLGDVADVGERKGDPYLSLYAGESVVNWDESSGDDTLDIQSLNLVVLDESENERTGFEWRFQRKHRVLVLGPAETNEADQTPGAIFRLGVFRSESFAENALLTPLVNGQPAREIPFAFINDADISAEPSTPPLLGLSNLALTFYRGQADYRQSLFMQGQDTLVVVGSTLDQDSEAQVGAGARIDLPVGADAKYIGVSSSGLAEQRAALENDATEAGHLSGRLLDSSSGAKESGEALKVRVAARTSTLVRVAQAGAFGLQEVLRKLARWYGADPDLVVVTPNLEFADQSMTGDELGKLVSAKTMGAPLSLQSMHALMAQRGLTSLSFDEELETLEGEAALELAPPPSTNPDGPAADDPNADDLNADPNADPDQ